jgi:muconate cycloisomerase
LRCALELSLLDAYGRLFEQSVSEVVARTASDLNLQKTQQQVRYSGVITAAAPGSELCSALEIRAYGFAQCKIKVGMPGVDDADRLTRLRRWLGSRMDLRLDANEAWKAEEVKSRLQSFLLHRISAIEQPVAHQDVDVLTEVRREFPIRLMLDESLTCSLDASMAIRKGTCDLFNTRLSKCGGIFNSLRLAAMTRDAGLGYQLGCHPGESGILSAAGRHFATNVANLTYLEGSYDRHVLGRSLTKEDITFGYGGRAPALLGHGLGVVVKPDALRKMAVACQSYQLN